MTVKITYNQAEILSLIENDLTTNKGLTLPSSPNYIFNPSSGTQISEIIVEIAEDIILTTITTPLTTPYRDVYTQKDISDLIKADLTAPLPGGRGYTLTVEPTFNFSGDSVNNIRFVRVTVEDTVVYP